MDHRSRAFAVSCLFISCALACTTLRPENRPVDEWSQSTSLRARSSQSQDRSGELFLGLTFSGGGTRAAAFAYGVLQEVAATTVTLDGEQRRLFDEIDLVSSVSGGSFAAAYLGLHGDGIFESFERAFLRRNLQGNLFFELMRPRNWLRMFRMDRSQVTASYYDRKIFDGATFADLHRPGAPEIVLNATDLASGNRFPFSPLTFGMICSDLDAYPIANAVTASSAVPVVFPTIRLRNYAGRCGFEPPEVITQRVEGEPVMTQMLRDSITSRYADPDKHPYVHLLDGGLSDNLGLLNAVGMLSLLGDPKAALDNLAFQDLRHIIVLVVNAEVATERSWQLGNRSPSPLKVLSGLSGAQIENMNHLTLGVARQLFDGWADQLSTPEVPVYVSVIEISFEKLKNPDQASYLRTVETSFNLTNRKVDDLIAAGRQIVRESSELQAALAKLQGEL